MKPCQTTAAQLRLLLPEVARRYQERIEEPLAALSDPVTQLQQLADAMSCGQPAETALAGVLPADASNSAEQAPQFLDQTLQGYHLLQRALIEVLEARDALEQEARFYIEDAFHAAARETVRAHFTPEERLVRDSEEQLRALVASNILGVVRSNLDGRILDANDAFLNLVGYTTADLTAGCLDWRRLTPSEYRELDDRSTAQVLATGRCDLYEKEYLHQDGTRITAMVGRALANRERGDCITYVLDRTRQKELEDALRERVEEIEQANQHLNQFLAMIAHELRTPLSTIGNALYILESLPLADKAARQVAAAARQTRHAARLVGDLMDLSRVARGKIELRREPLMLRRVAADAVESARPLMEAQGHH